MAYRYVSTPNMAVMGTNSLAKAPEIGWRSTPNLKFTSPCDRRIPELSKHRYSKGLLDDRLCVSAPNISVNPNLASETHAEIGWRSTPNIKFNLTRDIRKPEIPIGTDVHVVHFGVRRRNSSGGYFVVEVLLT